MSTALKYLDRILEGLLFAALAAMSTVVFTNVFCRFVLHFSLSWGDELAQVLLVWLTFLGAAVATRDKAHYAFDYLVRNLPTRLGKFFVLLGHLIVIAMTAGLLYWSGRVTWEIRAWVMPAMGFSRSLVYGACPVGCVFILVYAVRNFVADLRMSDEIPKDEEPAI